MVGCLVVAALCILMALSLLWIGLHWLSDILGGTLIGLAVLALACLLPVPGLRSPPDVSLEAQPGLPRQRATELPGLHNG